MAPSPPDLAIARILPHLLERERTALFVPFEYEMNVKIMLWQPAD